MMRTMNGNKQEERLLTVHYLFFLPPGLICSGEELMLTTALYFAAQCIIIVFIVFVHSSICSICTIQYLPQLYNLVFAVFAITSIVGCRMQGEGGMQAGLCISICTVWYLLQLYSLVFAVFVQSSICCICMYSTANAEGKRDAGWPVHQEVKFHFSTFFKSFNRCYISIICKTRFVFLILQKNVHLIL